jgi:hypothetical protein
MPICCTGGAPGTDIRDQAPCVPHRAALHAVSGKLSVHVVCIWALQRHTPAPLLAVPTRYYMLRTSST